MRPLCDSLVAAKRVGAPSCVSLLRGGGRWFGIPRWKSLTSVRTSRRPVVINSYLWPGTARINGEILPQSNRSMVKRRRIKRVKRSLLWVAAAANNLCQWLLLFMSGAKGSGNLASAKGLMVGRLTPSHYEAAQTRPLSGPVSTVWPMVLCRLTKQVSQWISSRIEREVDDPCCDVRPLWEVFSFDWLDMENSFCEVRNVSVWASTVTLRWGPLNN